MLPGFTLALLWICSNASLFAQGFVLGYLPHQHAPLIASSTRHRKTSFTCGSKRQQDTDDTSDQRYATPEVAEGISKKLTSLVASSPRRSALFSLLMALSGAALGPFLDSFHSAFGVLQYNTPITAQLWGSVDNPALITSWWVPELFGLAGFLIGWLYVWDTALYGKPLPTPSPPKICLGISFFTLQYWLSGVLFQAGVDRVTILNVMSLSAVVGFAGLDQTLSGFLTSAATAIGGPLIEVGLIHLTVTGVFVDGYHYMDPGETGFFPLWIVPVYFLGGPANGNLARGYWSWLSEEKEASATSNSTVACAECNSTRRVECPNW